MFINLYINLGFFVLSTTAQISALIIYYLSLTQIMNLKNKKNFILLVLIANFLVQIVYNQQVCTDAVYRQYLNTFNKTQTKDPDLFNQKKNIFCNNLLQISTVNRQNLTYTLKITKFIDLTESELSQYISPINNQQILQLANPITIMPKHKLRATTTSSLNWTAGGFVTSVKDQGQCNSCWAFGTAALYESFMLTKGAPQFDLSQEYILECTTGFTKNSQKANRVSDCETGGYMSDAATLAYYKGIPLQADYPYKGYDYSPFTGSPHSGSICESTHNVMYQGKTSFSNLLYAQNFTTAEMKFALAISPVMVQLYATTLFTTYSSGIYTGCPQFNTSYEKINHVVLLVGYDSNNNWIVKNQWGTSWGQNGYATISNKNDCALTSLGMFYKSDKPYTGVNFYSSQKSLVYYGILFFMLFSSILLF